jgi:hypothetical protein
MADVKKISGVLFNTDTLTVSEQKQLIDNLYTAFRIIHTETIMSWSDAEKIQNIKNYIEQHDEQTVRILKRFF